MCENDGDRKKTKQKFEIHIINKIPVHTHITTTKSIIRIIMTANDIEWGKSTLTHTLCHYYYTRKISLVRLEKHRWHFAFGTSDAVIIIIESTSAQVYWIDFSKLIVSCVAVVAWNVVVAFRSVFFRVRVSFVKSSILLALPALSPPSMCLLLIRGLFKIEYKVTNDSSTLIESL